MPRVCATVIVLPDGSSTARGDARRGETRSRRLAIADTLARPAEDDILRIAIVIERFVPGTGGVENVAWRVAHELVRQGEDVTVLARETTADRAVPTEATTQARAASLTEPSGRTGASAIAVERLAVPRFWQPLRVILFSRAAGRAAASRRFDVVHGFARARHQDLYRAGGGSHADYLARSHAGLALAVRRLSPRHRTLLALERGVFRDPAQRIQCASRLVADALVEHEGVNRERILLLPNAVDADAFASPEAAREGARLRARLDPLAERIWLLAGSGWRRKGLGTALEAIARLRDDGLRLWVAGRDDPTAWRARVDAMGLTHQVRFLGTFEGIERLYHAVDGLLLPTRYDPFANVTLEAAAAGRPVVTSAANGAAEWLGDDVRVVCEAEDAGGFAEALDSLREAAPRRALGERARVRARGYDWPGHVEALRDEYARIVESHHRRASA